MAYNPNQPQPVGAGQKQSARVISVLEVPSQDPNRLGQMDTLITYQIDPLHSFTIRVNKAPLTPAEVDAAVRNDWATRKQLIGRSVEL